mmetsp:Transcript_4371/g.15364  ORF Transcript_4371/g.15364 Transcript_4371/m.15364 type:complete len:266 (+) Transcript_4371:324-1121(+)
MAEQLQVGGSLARLTCRLDRNEGDLVGGHGEREARGDPRASLIHLRQVAHVLVVHQQRVLHHCLMFGKAGHEHQRRQHLVDTACQVKNQRLHVPGTCLVKDDVSILAVGQHRLEAVRQNGEAVAVWQGQTGGGQAAAAEAAVEVDGGVGDEVVDVAVARRDEEGVLVEAVEACAARNCRANRAELIQSVGEAAVARPEVREVDSARAEERVSDNSCAVHGYGEQTVAVRQRNTEVRSKAHVVAVTVQKTVVGHLNVAHHRFAVAK